MGTLINFGREILITPMNDALLIVHISLSRISHVSILLVKYRRVFVYHHRTNGIPSCQECTDKTKVKIYLEFVFSVAAADKCYLKNPDSLTA